MIESSKTPLPPASARSKDVPPLRSGDRLTRPEFERRYQAMPENVKAELVEGVVYVMPSPVRYDQHGSPHLRLATWLGNYESRTQGVGAGDNSTIRLDLDNEPQPDLCLRILAEHGGRSRVSSDGYIEGAPELVAEIAASSVNYDLHDKMRAYRRNGVEEYLVWRTEDREFDWFVMELGRFEPRAADPDGFTRSRVFPGLWLDRAALSAGDFRRVLDVLESGLASPEHEAFVARLAKTGP